MVKINRICLLDKLELVSPGLSKKELIEQSDTFVFKGGKVLTFNDEIACSIDADLGGFEGSINALKLKGVLGRFENDTIEVINKTDKLVLRSKEKGASRQSAIQVERRIFLAVDVVDGPKEWSPLNVDFEKAVSLVCPCTLPKSTGSIASCVYLHKDHMDACDNYQIARYGIKIPISKSMLVYGSSLKQVVGKGMVSVSVSESWIHFQNSEGLIMSCRLFREGTDTMEGLEGFLSVKGQKLTWPENLLGSVKGAELFSSDSEKEVEVAVKGNKVRIKGSGSYGYFSEVRKLEKDFGKDVSFRIQSKILKEVLKRPECVVGEGKLKSECGSFTHVVCTILE